MGIKHSRPVPPFMRYCSAIIPTMFDDSLSYYEALCALNRFIQTNLVEVINNNAIVTQEYIDLANQLKEYVENYFDNLDVQEEINNKLDAMAEAGTLSDIISEYLNSIAIFGFDTVASMKNADNLINGSYAKTLGYYSKNDGGGALYKIRTVTNDDDIDESFIIEMNDSGNILVAELQYDKVIDVKTLGCKADKTSDCSSIIQNAIDKLDDATLFFPHGAYKFDSAITSKAGINYQGQFKQTYVGLSDEGLFFNGTNGFINCSFNRFKGMLLQNETYDDTVTTTDNCGIIINGSGTYVEDSTFVQFKAGIYANYRSVICTHTSFHSNGWGIYSPVDSRIVDNTFNIQHHSAIFMQAGSNDNIITNNKIEWNAEFGIAFNGTCYNCTISNNIFDRNGKAGLGIGGSSANNVISNNIFRRNGATSTGADSANIRINGAYDNIITNNTTAVANSQDDGSGTNVPLYALYAVDTHDNLLSLINNDLTGGTESNPVNLLRCDNVYRLDNVKPVYENLLIATKHATASANGGTATYEIPFESEPQNYTYGYYKKLVIRTRNANDGDHSVKPVWVYFYKAYGTLRASVSESTLLTDVTLSVSYDAENGVVLTVTNNKSVNVQARVDVYTA